MANRYSQIIEDIFFAGYKEGESLVPFERSDITETAAKLGIDLPLNIGDIIYTFRFRSELPDKVQGTAPAGQSWVIAGKGRSKYAFELRKISRIRPDALLSVTKVPDATPGIVARYAFSDEQALLAKLRYNRLIDIFTGITCYSIQNHLRTTVAEVGQVETDEIYIGLDKKGAHYVFPVQAKGAADEIGIIQIEQDIALCREKLPVLKCRSIATQFMPDGVIALFEFGLDREAGIVKLAERHYKLTPPEELSDKELQAYGDRPDD